MSIIMVISVAETTKTKPRTKRDDTLFPSMSIFSRGEFLLKFVV